MAAQTPCRRGEAQIPTDNPSVGSLHRLVQVCHCPADTKRKSGSEWRGSHTDDKLRP